MMTMRLSSYGHGYDEQVSNDIDLLDKYYLFPELAGEVLCSRPDGKLAFFQHERESDDDTAVALLPTVMNSVLVAQGSSAYEFSNMRSAIGHEIIECEREKPHEDMRLLVTPLSERCKEVSNKRINVPFQAWTGQIDHAHGTASWIRHCSDTSELQHIFSRQSLFSLMGLMIMTKDRVINHVPVVLLDTHSFGSGRYTMHVGDQHYLSLDVARMGKVIDATWRYDPQHEINRRNPLHYVMLPLPIHDMEDSVVVVSTNRMTPIGVNVNVYRSNYRTIGEKAAREVEQAETSLEKTKDDLAKAETAL